MGLLQTLTRPFRREVALSTLPAQGSGYENPAVTSANIKEDLFAPHGATGTVFLQGIIREEEYNPDLEGDKAIHVYQRMWRSDGEVAALIAVLALPLLQAAKTIEPASADQFDVDVAQFVQDNLFGGLQHSFASTDEYLTRAYLRDGVAVLEKVYVKGADGKVRLRKLAERLAKTLYRWYPDDDDNLDRIQQRVYKTAPDGLTGQYDYPVIAAKRLVVFTNQQEGNNFLGVSVLRHAYKHWFIKDQLERIAAVQAERMAVGVPTFSEPPGPVQKSDRDQAALVGASLHAHEKAYVILPHGWEFRFTTPGTPMDLIPYIEYHSLQMVRSVLAQFLNLDKGGSYALSMDISSFFTQALQARAAYLAGVWNTQVIKPLVDLNFTVERYPKLVYGDLDKRDIDKFLVGLAAVLPWLTKNAETENAVRELLGFPDLPADASLAGGGTPTVETSGQGASADPQQTGTEVATVAAQADRKVASAKPQPVADANATVPEDADAAMTLLELRRWRTDLRRGEVHLSRRFLPDWVTEGVNAALAQPVAGLRADAYADIVFAQAEALLSAELASNKGNPQALRDWFNAGADGRIAWGQHGDFAQCVAVAGKYMDDPEGYCNERHQDAVGGPPGSEDKHERG